MPKIVVTGGSGKAGRAVVRELLEHGYSVVNVDIAPDPNRACPRMDADLMDLGKVFDVLRDADGVIHLAALLGGRTQQEIFHVNTMTTYNVFHAATSLGMKRIVWASSETVLGLPFVKVKPAEMPIDESHAFYPESGYSLSKVVGEQMAEQFARWTGASFVGLRFSNVMEPHDYAEQFPKWQDDATKRRWNLWGYIDCRDLAQACRLSLDAPVEGAEAFIIANADTVMRTPNEALLAEVFPESTLRAGTDDHETLLSIDKARRVLGYEPKHSWRSSV